MLRAVSKSPTYERRMGQTKWRVRRNAQRVPENRACTNRIHLNECAPKRVGNMTLTKYVAIATVFFI